jgi:hypothetical protein
MKKIYAHQGRNLKGSDDQARKLASADIAPAKVFSICGIN